MSTTFGEQMRPAYDMYRALYPHVFTRPLEVREDGSSDRNAPDYQPYHIESGVEFTGQPWTRVQKGYMGADGTGIALWQKAHEFMGHIALGLLGQTVREPFWKARFGSCQYQVMPKSWALAMLERNATLGIWADLPVEIFAEAATNVFSTGGPGDRSMDWGCDLDVASMRTWFDSVLVPVTQPSPPTGGAMKIIDLRSRLTLVAANVPFPSHASKDSNTVHWTGGSDTVVTDDQALAAIKRWHQEHISKNWGTASAVQGGAGIMYLEVIAPSGTVFLTRDSDAVTWHCSNPYGNAHSRPILVICDQDDLPTQAQLDSLEQRLTFPNVYPHQFWVGTACPGPQLLAYLASRGEDMFTEDDRRKLNRVYDHLEAYETMAWLQRLQDWLSKVFKSFPVYARPTDYTGPDVTSGKPRT